MPGLATGTNHQPLKNLAAGARGLEHVKDGAYSETNDIPMSSLNAAAFNQKRLNYAERRHSSITAR
jgi:hypothetical protein